MSGSPGGYGSSYGGSYGGGYGASTGGMYGGYGGMGGYPGQYGGGYGGYGQYNPMSRPNAYGGFNPYIAPTGNIPQLQTMSTGSMPLQSFSPANQAVQTDQLPVTKAVNPIGGPTGIMAGGGGPLQSFSPANAAQNTDVAPPLPYAQSLMSGSPANPAQPYTPPSPIQSFSPATPLQPAMSTPSMPQPPAPLAWRNMTPGQRAEAMAQKSLGGQQPTMTQPTQPATSATGGGTGGYGTGADYRFESVPSTLDPNSMNFLLNWMGYTQNGQNPNQQSQNYLNWYRQTYPNGVPGVNNPTTPNTNYITGPRF